MCQDQQSIGYKMLEGKGEYAHYFGGDSIQTPSCPNCKTPMHLILRFDLSDPVFRRVNADFSVLPLVSCLNCSGCWETQFFKIEENQVKVLLQKDEQHWIMDEEDRLPVPLPEVSVKRVPLEEEEILFDSTTDDQRDIIFDRFGTEYIARLFGGPVEDSPSEEKCRCLCCNEEMVHVAAVTEDAMEGTLITVIPFSLGELIFNFFLCAQCRVIRVEPLTS
ncbi:hypothetical protein [Pseudobacillus badius]|uniref:hypothetical protein n=1 Tax=Bacillus badius TaxID=1455 RepID=UPI0007B0B1C8|nr:hypothetical protein [Bacillus badius]KZO01831.1 hypothetical protein A4244_01795 [Bacillus badius]OCS90222.1 hypothetical protein A6M11_01795 [Bacillus badius]OVE53752.1 hypothetical protein B1A98_02865 [Bacillus badius]